MKQIYRGCHSLLQLQSILTFQTAGGFNSRPSNEDHSGKPSEAEIRKHFEGEIDGTAPFAVKKRTYHSTIEWTTSSAIASQFAKRCGNLVVEAMVDEQRMAKGSGSEAGVVLWSTTPIIVEAEFRKKMLQQLCEVAKSASK